MTFDVAVIGLGAMGSAALYHLARRNVRAVGIERFSPGHERGSSHGSTRIIRLGYFEHPSYVPLLRRAYALWRELEAASGRSLMTITGIAEVGAEDSELVQGTLASSRLHDLPHEILDATALMRRYPAFCLPADFIGVVQPDGGYLEAEAAVQTHLDLASAAGADIRDKQRVLAIEPHARGVRIILDSATIDANAAIVTAGPWTTSLLPDLPIDLQVTRQAVLWTEPADRALFMPERFPVFMIETDRGIHYGFPLHGSDGVKIAKHHHSDEIVDPETYDRQVRPQDERVVRDVISEYLPAANGKILSAKTCLYTMSPDEHFIVDVLSGHPQIVVASPCSGHGFKFAPVIGETLADLALSGQTTNDISRFRLARFS
ncbi:MAG: N-methyl-L-tryptophan oxidase [Pseudorhodoplanes sp.]|jgi:sarcosine oxidase|nr:N-methyl-L-tryptophan oxidase [Pseudorhodoplanes sp.]